MIPDDHWKPIDLQILWNLFSGTSFRWCLGGGYCVEKFVGEAYRSHSDVDIIVFRNEQLQLQEHLRQWQLYCSDPPGHLRPWPAGEYLEKGIHDIWGHRQGKGQWELQVMLQEISGERWLYRRHDGISGNVEDFTETYDGWPCIRIELQLFYKSKGLRERDQQDFERCLPLLDEARRQTLRSLLDRAYPKGHIWLEKLGGI